MYGLPGDPNSVRLNRNTTETRIHCLWNHLIETASIHTGSLLIWDTGTYSVLPHRSKNSPSTDLSSPPSSPPFYSRPTQQTLLHAAFQNRKIRIQLRGSRLPEPYVLNLRLTKSEELAGRVRSGGTHRKRRGRGVRTQAQRETSDEDEVENDESEYVLAKIDTDINTDNLSAMEHEIRELEDEEISKTNAYPGASNTIGSVHQRRWYLSLNRPACGLVEKRTKGRSVWELDDSEKTEDKGSKNGRLSYPFYVRGADHERSVVTGRQGADILRDEGVNKFIQRQGWKPVLN